MILVVYIIPVQRASIIDITTTQIFCVYVSFIIIYKRPYIITIDCGFEMIVDIVHRTAVCGLVGITIYGLFLVTRGALGMEKARRKAVRLRKAENSSDNIDKVFISLSDVTAVNLIVI